MPKQKKVTVVHRQDVPAGKIIGLALVVMIIVGAGVVGIIFLTTGQLPNWPGGTGGQNTNTTTTTTTTTPGGQVATLTWEFTVPDNWGSGLASGVHVQIRGESGTLEEGETSSSGIFTTSLSYTSMEYYDILIGNGTDGWVPFWYRNVQVPLYNGLVISGAKHRSTLSAYDLGTFSLQITYGASRTSIADGGSWNKTADADKQETFYFTVRNTEADSGWMTSDNPIYDGIGGFDDLLSSAVLVIAFNGSEYQDVEWTNNPYPSDNDGARTEYFIALSDSDVTYDLDEYGQPISSGSREVSALLDFSNVAGATVDIVFSLILGVDVAWLQDHTGLPSSSVQWTQQTDMLINIVN